MAIIFRNRNTFFCFNLRFFSFILTFDRKLLRFQYYKYNKNFKEILENIKVVPFPYLQKLNNDKKNIWHETKTKIFKNKRNNFSISAFI